MQKGQDTSFFRIVFGIYVYSIMGSRKAVIIMTLYDFNKMDEQGQAEAVWDGTHIGERFDEEHNILLYQVHGFYVEAYCHRGIMSSEDLGAFRALTN